MDSYIGVIINVIDIYMEIKYNIYTKVNYGGECNGYQPADNE